MGEGCLGWETPIPAHLSAPITDGTNSILSTSPAPISSFILLLPRLLLTLP